jgi:hypothetical protein
MDNVYNLYKYILTFITKDDEYTIFDGTIQPNLFNYIKYLHIYFHKLKLGSDVYMLIYDLLYVVSDKLNITHKNVYRLLLTIGLIAIKMTDDKGILNSDYAYDVGITLKDINEMEIYFLKLVDYRVTPLEVRY